MRNVVIAALLAAVLAVGWGFGRQAWAQEAAGPDTTFVTRLAQALGLPVERVEAGVKAALTGMVDDALAAGRIDAEQAERAKARIEQGHLRLAPHFGPRHGGVRGAGLGLRRVAELLGLEPRQLLAELRQGRTLAQVAEARGKTRQQVVEALLAPVAERLDAAVAAGRIGAEEAERRLAEARTRAERLLDRAFPGVGPRGDE